MGDVLLDVDKLIETIEIGGLRHHDRKRNSTDFAGSFSFGQGLAVLKIPVDKCSLPESK
jgi:hypothetical protein